MNSHYRFPFLVEIQMPPFNRQSFGCCRMLPQSCGDNMTSQTCSYSYEHYDNCSESANSRIW